MKMASVIGSWVTRQILFDSDDQAIFLAIVSAQLRSGRTYPAIFRDLQTDANRYIRELARRSLSPTTQFFAENYAYYLGARRSELLVLAQRHNSVHEFIDHIINPKTPISFYHAVFLSLAAEWITLALLITAACALYSYNDSLVTAGIDFSTSQFYAIGEFLTVYRYPILITIGLNVYLYLAYQNSTSAVRQKLKRLGLYRFNDSLYAIDLFTTFRILTSSAAKGGAAINVPSLFDELSRMYGATPLRQKQFSAIRYSLSHGSTLRESLASTDILSAAEMSLYRGLTASNTLEEHHAAAGAVVDQLTAKTRLQLKRFSQSTKLMLYSLVGILLVFAMVLALGGGMQLLDTY